MFNFLTFNILISTREELLCFMVPSWPMSHPGLEQLTGDTARVESRGAGCLTSGGVVRALRIDALLCEVSYQQHGIICLA